MQRMKWLYPGMRVKRWLALLAVGVFAVATGIIILLNTPVFSLYEKKILDWAAGWDFHPVFLGAVLIGVGAICVALAVRFGIRSVVGAIRPADVPNLVEHVYKTRTLRRGCIS